MITSFVVTLIECLEIAFITLLIVQTNTAKRDGIKQQHLQVLPQVQIIMYGILGLIAGFFAAFYLHEILEDYEWAMYAILSGLFFYLFFTSKNMASHIEEHIQMLTSKKTQASQFMIFIVTFLIYSRESMEIFTNLLLNKDSSWFAAGVAVVVAGAIYCFARRSNWKKYIFKYGYIAYLGFGAWFGYEALEHLHIF